MTTLTLFSGAQSIEQTLAAANIFIKSGLAPKGLKTPEAVVVAVAYGAELGLSPMQSLNTIHIIDSKPVVSANALQALALSKGGRIVTVEHDDKTCTLDISRPDHPTHRETFTKIDANQQNLLGKDPWIKMPKQMLYARCVSNGVRKVFADVLAGLYSTEEMLDAASPLPQPSAPITVEKAPAKPRSVSKKELDIGLEVETAKPAVTMSAVLDIEPVVETPAIVEPEMPVAPPPPAPPAGVQVFDRNDPTHIAELCLQYSRHYGVQPSSEVLAQLTTWYQSLGRPVSMIDDILRAQAEKKRKVGA